MKFSVNIDLKKNELQQATLHKLTSAPSNPALGQLYFNTTDNIGYEWDGTIWQPLFRLKIDDANATLTDVWSSLKIQTELNNLSSQIAGGMDFKGSYDASTNTPDIESGTGVNIGDTYVVTANGQFYTEDVQVGDMVIAKSNGASSLTEWVTINKNIPDIVDASNTQKGIIRIATDVEANTGTDELTAVNPKQLKAAIQGASQTFSIVQSLGDTEGDTIITHNLGTLDTVVEFADNATGETIICDVLLRTLNNITVRALGTSKDYRIIIKG